MNKRESRRLFREEPRLKVYAFLSLVVMLLLGILVRLENNRGPLFEQGIQISRQAWKVFDFSSEGIDKQRTVEVLRATFHDLRGLPNDTQPLVLLLGLIYLIAGVNDFTSILPSLLSFCLISFLVYYLGRKWFGYGAGAVALFLWIILPVGIFLSVSLTPSLLIILGSLAAIIFFTVAELKSSPSFYILSFFTIAVGMAVDWTFFISTGGILIAWLVYRRRVNINNHLSGILVVLALLILVIPNTGRLSADLYYQSLLIFENFYLVPLAILAFVLAASNIEKDRIRFLLLWIFLKIAFLAVLANWISQSPWIDVIGMSAYWLEISIPVIVLIAWQLAEYGDPNFILIGLLVVSLGLVLMLLTSGIYTNPLFENILVISRIAFGLSFISIFIYLILMDNHRLGTRMSLTILLLSALASPAIVNNYVQSYVFMVEDSREALSVANSLGRGVNLIVGDDKLYERILYSNQFQEETKLPNGESFSLDMLSRRNPGALPTNSYVLVSEEYQKFSLGDIPENWRLVTTIANSPWQTLLFYDVSSGQE